MLFIVTGTDIKTAKEILSKAFPILRECGAPVDGVNTLAVIPSAIVVNGKADEMEISPVTLYFPAFDALRNGVDLLALAQEMANQTGVPCYTLDAAVIAGFAG